MQAIYVFCVANDLSADKVAFIITIVLKTPFSVSVAFQPDQTVKLPARSTSSLDCLTCFELCRFALS